MKRLTIELRGLLSHSDVSERKVGLVLSLHQLFLRWEHVLSALPLQQGKLYTTTRDDTFSIVENIRRELYIVCNESLTTLHATLEEIHWRWNAQWYWIFLCNEEMKLKWISWLLKLLIWLYRIVRRQNCIKTLKSMEYFTGIGGSRSIIV